MARRMPVARERDTFELYVSNTLQSPQYYSRHSVGNESKQNGEEVSRPNTTDLKLESDSVKKKKKSGTLTHAL